jgi:glycosyltransferase involved in cell wall biosynthesis
MTNRPFISIVIPTYNHAHFLEEALQSVINQTYKEWEAIVVNNYSDDRTVEVVNEFGDPRIKLINFKNHGIIAAGRNKGISISSGEYVAFLDSDDVWYPDKLKECIKLLNQGFDLVCHGEYWVKKDNKRNIIYGPEKKARYRSLLFNGNCISTSATVVRKSALDKVGRFCESSDMVTAEDYELWLKLSRSGAKIKFIDKILGEYRIHDANNSKAVITNMLAEQTVIDKHISMLGELNTIDTLLARRRKGLVYYGAGRGFHSNQDYMTALSYFLKSWTTYPFISRLYVAVFLSLYRAILK